ncbi:hypothetical protein DFH11DRAFT_709147 [Phellopilus nigrolimitatus]|nr:hypothetical protein DFH11DRAFT_709147 [Phellopilus nigrolimitatus]
MNKASLGSFIVLVHASCVHFLLHREKYIFRTFNMLSNFCRTCSEARFCLSRSMLIPRAELCHMCVWTGVETARTEKSMRKTRERSRSTKSIIVHIAAYLGHAASQGPYMYTRWNQCSRKLRLRFERCELP